LAGDKERGPIWPDPAGWRNRTARPDVLCQHSRYTVEHNLKADRANADVAAMLHSIGIRLTISWQCDKVVSPAVRHSGRSTFRRSSIAVSNFYYIDANMHYPVPVLQILSNGGDVASNKL